MLKKSFVITIFIMLLTMILPVTAIAAEQNNQTLLETGQNSQQVQQSIDNKESNGQKEIQNDMTSLTSDIVIQQNERVNGNITTASGNISIYGKVNGNVTTGTGDINIKSTAKIVGNVTAGTGKITRDPGAQVIGSIFQGDNRYNNVNINGFGVYRPTFFERTLNSITTLLGLIAIIAIILSIFPRNLQKMLGAFDLEPGRIVIIGILGWIVLPLALVVSVITIIGPIVIMLGAFLSLLIGTVLVSLLLGEKVKELFNWQNDNKIFTAVLGLFVLWLASLLPIAQVFVVITCAVIGMGIVLVTKFGTGRPWFPPRNKVVSETSFDTGTVEIVNPNKGGDDNEKSASK